MELRAVVDVPGGSGGAPGAPWACHASTLLPLGGGEALVAFFAGSHEGEPDTRILLARLRGGRVESLRAVADGPEALWNPVLFPLEGGRIALFWHEGNEIARWRCLLALSQDGGASFGAPRELRGRDGHALGPSRNLPVRLSSGRIVLPNSREDGPWRVMMDLSDDGLATIEEGAEICYDDPAADLKVQERVEVSEQSFAGRGIIQPAPWEDTEGVHALLRSTFGQVLRIDSTDGGRSFGAPYPIGVPNNNSGLCVAHDPSRGDTYLVCNPVPGNWGARSPLSVLRSHGGGAFETVFQLESGPGEYSYPCAALDGAGGLIVSYTLNRSAIRVAVLAL
ncbi:MAG: exo-alpha-sialidase [Succinivibrionaceae bacterium]|nr:exo-alpha-sialidase [Succinivibrionaceae bacterium]